MDKEISEGEEVKIIAASGGELSDIRSLLETKLIDVFQRAPVLQGVATQVQHFLHWFEIDGSIKLIMKGESLECIKGYRKAIEDLQLVFIQAGSQKEDKEKR